MEHQAYLEVENRKQADEAYELKLFNTLYNIVKIKLPTAKYMHIETLWDPESNSTVFNLMFFDDDEESIGGMELAPYKIIWDDEDTNTD